MKNIVIVMLCSMLLLVPLAACNQPTVEEAQTEVCTSLNELRTALANLTPVTADTDVATAQAAVDQVRSAWNNVEAAKETLAQVRQAELEASYDQYQQTIASIPGEATLGQAGQTIAQGASQFLDEAQAIYAELNCE